MQPLSHGNLVSVFYCVVMLFCISAVLLCLKRTQTNAPKKVRLILDLSSSISLLSFAIKRLRGGWVQTFSTDVIRKYKWIMRFNFTALPFESVTVRSCILHLSGSRDCWSSVLWARQKVSNLCNGFPSSSACPAATIWLKLLECNNYQALLERGKVMGLPLILENKTLDCLHGGRVMGQKVCARKWSATL